jgi:hypothetical protein
VLLLLLLLLAAGAALGLLPLLLRESEELVTCRKGYIRC